MHDFNATLKTQYNDTFVVHTILNRLLSVRLSNQVVVGSTLARADIYVPAMLRFRSPPDK